jgi:DNA replication protein DnaC
MWTQQRTGKLAEAHRAARILVADPRWFFTVTGPYGAGKTGLLAAIVNAGRAAGRTSVYTTTADMLDYLRDTFGPRAEATYSDRLELLKTCDILALDEFDRYSPTPWAEEKFFQIIEARYENGPHCLTVFATNSKIASVTGYVRSRMEDARCQVWELPSGDHRKGK